LIGVAGHSVVLVVAENDLLKPITDLTDAIMLSAPKLGLYSLELREHSRFRNDPPDCERLGLMALPQEWVKPRKLKFPVLPRLAVRGLGRHNA